MGPAVRRPLGVEGKPLLIVHGCADRGASPARAAALAARLDRRTEVNFVLVKGAGHAMLHHRREFSRRAADFSVATLLRERPGATPSSMDRHATRATSA